MKYTLRRPCAKCPFRSDIRAFLTAERVEGLEESLLEQDATFTCHETTVPTDDEDDEDFGDMMDGPNAQHCAGALILLEKLDAPNQMMRVAERLGMYDRTKLDMDAPVFDDFDDMAACQPR